MKIRYVTGSRLTTFGEYADDIYSPSITVHESSNEPIDTGLLSAAGQKLYRVVEREPIGFRPRRIES